MSTTSIPKVVLITGCSSGFGLLIAARLAGQGHHVIATMRDVSKKERLLIEAQKRGGGENLTVLPLDVTNVQSIKLAVKETVARHGVIDVLINNAGYGVGGFFEDLTEENYREQFNVNFFGVLNVTREVLPVMRPRRKGRIINISSMAAFSGTLAFSAYCSSKWALEGFSECLYMELKPFGIDVALVEPGSYRTKIFEENARYAKNFDSPGSPYYGASQHLKRLVNKHLGQNHRDPEQVAKTLEALVEDQIISFRNVIGFSSKWRYFVLKFIPFKIYAWLVNKLLLPRD